MTERHIKTMNIHILLPLLSLSFHHYITFGCRFNVVNGESVECVHETKLLGLWINDRLNWNTHVEEMYAKAAKRLYLLVQLRRAGVNQVDLCKYY